MNEFSARLIDALRNCENPAVQRLAGQAVEVREVMRIDGISPGGHPFYITTQSGSEVTVGLGKHWHTHLGNISADCPDKEPLTNVIRFLIRLVSDEITIVEAYENETYVGSRTQARGERRREVKRANRYITISWSGRYNSESRAR